MQIFREWVFSNLDHIDSKVRESAGTGLSLCLFDSGHLGLCNWPGERKKKKKKKAETRYLSLSIEAGTMKRRAYNSSGPLRRRRTVECHFPSLLRISDF